MAKMPLPAAPGIRGRSALHVIPEIDLDRMHYWRQPPRERIVINDSYAYMSAMTWLSLAAYDETIPTAVYPGKMWRCSPSRGPDAGRHFLLWFGTVEGKPNLCSNNIRDVRIVTRIE